MRAAAVGGAAGDDAVAAAAEDAGPAGQQPGQVGPDEVLGVGRVGELDPLPGEVEPDLARHRHRHAGHATPRRFALRAPEAVSFLFRGRAGLGRAGWDVTRAGPVRRPRRFRTHRPATRTHRVPPRTPATRDRGRYRVVDVGLPPGTPGAPDPAGRSGTAASRAAATAPPARSPRRPTTWPPEPVPAIRAADPPRTHPRSAARASVRRTRASLGSAVRRPSRATAASAGRTPASAGRTPASPTSGRPGPTWLSPASAGRRPTRASRGSAASRADIDPRFRGPATGPAERRFDGSGAGPAESRPPVPTIDPAESRFGGGSRNTDESRFRGPDPAGSGSAGVSRGSGRLGPIWRSRASVGRQRTRASSRFGGRRMPASRGSAVSDPAESRFGGPRSGAERVPAAGAGRACAGAGPAGPGRVAVRRDPGRPGRAAPGSARTRPSRGSAPPGRISPSRWDRRRWRRGRRRTRTRSPTPAPAAPAPRSASPPRRTRTEAGEVAEDQRRRGRARRARAGADPPVGHLRRPDADRRRSPASASGSASTGSGRPGRSTRCPRSASPPIAMLVLARALRRRHGRDLDLLTAVVTAGVSTVLTVLPGRVHPAGTDAVTARLHWTGERTTGDRAAGQGRPVHGLGLPGVARRPRSSWPPALGYDGVEVMVWTDPVSQDAGGAARLSDHYGVPILAVHAPCLLITQRVWGTEPWDQAGAGPGRGRAAAGADRGRAPAVPLAARLRPRLPPGHRRGWPRRPTSGSRWRTCSRCGSAAGRSPRTRRTGTRRSSRTGRTRWTCRHTAVSPRATPLELADDDGRPARARAHRRRHRRWPRTSTWCPAAAPSRAASCWSGWPRDGFAGSVVVEVNTRRAADRAEREADLAEALAFTRLHLVATAQPIG